MAESPLLMFHIGTGTIGLLTGSAAMFLRKGSDRHRLAGKLFVVAMLCMAASGSIMAFLLTEWTNVIGGLTTIYFVLTAWMTLRRPPGEAGLFEKMALIYAVAIITGNVFFALQTEPHANDVGATASLVFAGLMTISAGGDLRLILRGGIAGAQRILRHLWRMCYAVFIAAASLFLGQMQVFPAVIRETHLLFAVPFIPLVVMIFWLLRVRLIKKRKQPGILPGVP